MKRVRLLFAGLLAAGSLAVCFAPPAHARAGGAISSSGSSSSSSSGGSWRRSSRRGGLETGLGHGSGGYRPDWDDWGSWLFFGVMGTIGLSIVGLVGAIAVKAIKGEPLTFGSPDATSSTNRFDAAVQGRLGTPDATRDATVERFVRAYYDSLQRCWMTANLMSVSTVTSDALRERFRAQLEDYKARHQVNVVDRISVSVVRVMAVSTDQVIWVYVRGRMRDFLADARSREAIAGNDRHTAEFAEFWKLVPGGPSGFLFDEVRPFESGLPGVEAA